MNPWIKRIGLAVLALVALVVVFLASAYGYFSYRGSLTYNLLPEKIQVPTDTRAIAEGERLFVTRGCSDCHGENLAGKVVIDDPMAGVMAGANLTTGKGGRGGNHDNVSWALAIRHAVAPDGRPLIFMPSQEFHHISDGDLGRIIAYIKSVPPVDAQPPQTNPGPLLRVLYLLGEVPLLPVEIIDQKATHNSSIKARIDATFGSYIAKGCTGCHGAGFSGGPVPGTPPDFKPAANITPDIKTGIGNWKEADFLRALRTGKRPNGTELDAFMPWRNLGRMTDTELRALYQFLRTVPAKPYGNH